MGTCYQTFGVTLEALSEVYRENTPMGCNLGLFWQFGSEEFSRCRCVWVRFVFHVYGGFIHPIFET